MRYIAPALVALLVGLVATWALQKPIRAEVDEEALVLELAAHDVAETIDGLAHERITSAEAPEFLAIRTQLRLAHGRAKLRSPMYTLKRSGDGTEFVVMTNPAPFVGATYDYRPEMVQSFERGLRNRTAIYGDDHGRWISGYGVVRSEDRVVAIVCADRPADDLHAKLINARLLALLLAGLALILTVLAQSVLKAQDGLGAGVRRLVTGRLAVRIGLAGAIPVLAGVGVVSGLQLRQAQQDGLEAMRQRLLTVATVGAPRLDPALHAEIVRTKDPTSPAFLTLRDELRGIKLQAGLSTDVYTLRRDGAITRFGAMSNEEPFIGHTYELRPGVLETLEGGPAGVEGPYMDDHGAWISAWAPIKDAGGTPIAVLQVDEDVSGLMAVAQRRRLNAALFALAAMVLAFGVGAWISGSLAKPIRQIAGATRRVQDGQYEVDVPDGREDEVGSLARSVREMAVSLREKERLRDMFGKYMAAEVVRDLLGKDEIALDGEVREITVLITDIRGYTALTEELGASEVVALLNEYFGILVDAVLQEGGVIDKFMGDALLAWFGAPAPQADHRERAVRTAVSVLERCAEWNAERVARGLQPVATGVGLAAGDVVVGNIGSVQRLEYTAIGDAVNLSSRLCGKAAEGEILATADVAAVSDAFEEVGSLQVKGVSQPVPVSRIVIPTTATG